MSMTTETSTQQTNKRQAKRRQPLPSASVSGQQTLKEQVASIVYAPSPLAVDSLKFPLYKPFTLSENGVEFFLKLDKNTIVSLSSGIRYAASGQGYIVNILVK